MDLELLRPPSRYEPSPQAAPTPSKVTGSFPKSVNLTISHRTPSGFRMEGSARNIDFPSRKNILTTDRSVLSKGLVEYYNMLNGEEHLVIDEKNVVKTRDGIVIGSLGSIARKRHIRGCTTIWDIEQEKTGFKPASEALSYMDEIWMQNGDLWIDIKQSPSEKGTYLFLLMHNQNEDFPYRDDSIAASTFKINDHRKAAIKEIEVLDLKDEARQIAYEVRDRKTKRFDENKMSFYTSIFRKQLGGLNTSEEKFTRLLQMADEEPKLLVSSFNDGKVDYYAVVNNAFNLAILLREKGKVVNQATSQTIKTFKVGADHGQITEAIVDYYSSKDGEAEFQQLKNLVDAQLESVGV